MAEALYLNAAGTSWPKSATVRAAVAAALDADPSSWGADFEAQHAAVAGSFGVSDASQLLLTPGGTSALALAVADLPWAAGDAVLISGHEHLALERPVLALRDRGVGVVVAPRAGDEPVDLDFVQDKLRTGRVRLVAFTEACNVTGEILPRLTLTRLAREHGALTLVDGAQTAGWLAHELDRDDSPDLFAFTGHKALGGVWGIGGLYVRPGTKMRTPRRDAPNPGPGYCDGGSVDRAALAALAAAVGDLSLEPAPARLARAQAMAERLAEQLRRFEVHRVPGASLPTVCVSVPSWNPSALARELAEAGVLASGGEQCAPLAHRTLGTGSGGALRFSFGPSQGSAAADRAVAAMNVVCAAR